MWANPTEIEPQALTQIRNVAALPSAVRVAIMPDVHFGHSSTVGTVLATYGDIIPSVVGSDIGCGMAALRTSLTLADLPDSLRALRLGIEAAVPVGFNSYERIAPALRRGNKVRFEFDRLFNRYNNVTAPVGKRQHIAEKQTGTLGRGNHFIELITDEQDRVWIMLHSGSRGIGKDVADWHINRARGLDHNRSLPDRNLASLLAGSPEVDAYRNDLYWAQDYALVNRRVIMETVKQVLTTMIPTVRFPAPPVECHHNYVAEETHDGTDLVVTRKGAISAFPGVLGLIPGSMGTGSYMVEGLGNTAGLCSASHGAGRDLSRSDARNMFTLDDLAAQTAGVECRKDDGVLDEIPGAYRDLGKVIAAQTDGPSPLVKVIHKFTTLLTVKG